MKKKIVFLSLAFVFTLLSMGAGCKKPSMNGKLEVKSDPSGAEIFINEQDKNVVTPYTFDLKAGSYSLKLTREAFKDYEKEVIVEKGKTTKVEAELELLNPNIHKEVYKQAQEKVAFPVVYPTYLPEGFEMINSDIGEKGIEEEDLGGFSVRYSSTLGEFEIFEGTADAGNPEGVQKVELDNGTWGSTWSFVQGGVNIRYLYFGGGESYIYIIKSSNLSKGELIKIANSALSVQ